MNATSSYVCEQCGDVTTGDALCPPCLQGLERVAHAARAREAVSASVVAELIDAERATAEMVSSLGMLAELARTERFAPDPAALEMLAESMGCLRAGLRCLILRLGATEAPADLDGGIQAAGVER